MTEKTTLYLPLKTKYSLWLKVGFMLFALSVVDNLFRSAHLMARSEVAISIYQYLTNRSFILLRTYPFYGQVLNP